MSAAHNVRTVARFRPPNERELRIGFDFALSGIEITPPGTIRITAPLPSSMSLPPPDDVAGRTFDVTRVFGMDATQKQVFDCAAVGSVKDLFEGYNSTIFAYGQTGAGKSFTMFGGSTEETQGVIPRSIALLFETIHQSSENIEFTISCSYLEVYKEQLRDLLAVDQSKRLNIRQSPQKGIYVENLHVECVASEKDVFDCIRVGNEQRKVGQTNMNAVSSRSHCVFSIYLQQTAKGPQGTSKEAKLNLVDLAGSEKVSKSGASGETLEEAKKINLSLTCLSQCISALSSGSAHVPFRTSKLTRLLQESLGGNSKTTLVVACSPSHDNIEETIATLRFAQRCASITNKVHANVHLSAEQLTETVEQLNLELVALRAYSLALEKKMRQFGLDASQVVADARGTLVDVSIQWPEESSKTVVKPQINLTPQPAVIVQQEPHTVSLVPDSPPPRVAVSFSLAVMNARAIDFTQPHREETIDRIFQRVSDVDSDLSKSDVSIDNTQDDEDRDALVVHVRIMCTPTMIPAVLIALRNHHLGSLLPTIANKADIVVSLEEEPDVDPEHTRGFFSSTSLSSSEPLSRSEFSTHSEARNFNSLLEKLSQESTEDRAEIDALLTLLHGLRQDREGLGQRVAVKDVEVDAVKEQLIDVNMRLLEVVRQSKVRNAPSKQPPAPKPIVTTRNEDNDFEDRRTILKKLTFLPKKKNPPPLTAVSISSAMVIVSGRSSDDDIQETVNNNIMNQNSSRSPVLPYVSEELTTSNVHVSKATAAPATLKRPTIGRLKIGAVVPPPEDSFVPLPTATKQLGTHPSLAAPRKRVEEEVDDVLNHQEDLSKTVRRQQALIERQAEQLNFSVDRIKTAETTAISVTEEIERLQGQLSMLELRLFKNGLTQGKTSEFNAQASFGGTTTRMTARQTLSNIPDYETFRTNTNTTTEQPTLSSRDRDREPIVRLNTAAVVPIPPTTRESSFNLKQTMVQPTQRQATVLQQQQTSRMQPTNLSSVRDNSTNIRKPVKDKANSALSQSRNQTPGSQDSFSELLKTPMFISKLLSFGDSDGDDDGREEPAQPSKPQPKSFWAFGK
eukprot:c980_g1_i1.p1 GENE.c980_g1_i1~~c980_g1_i1.p1  ORF type:complete len:1075 (-),score=223.47 c980_g1_i1:20-3244(-)